MELSLKQKVAYGIGAVGKDVVYGFSATYIMYYYQDVLGLPSTYVGLIMLIARVFDAFNDPIMGVLVGKTRSRWGRFRPWIISGTVLNAVVLFALYSAPNIESTGLMVYFPVTYILWGMTYTMMDIPFWSMIPAVTRTVEARENLTIVGRTSAGIGYAIIVSSAMALVGIFGGGNEPVGFRWLALCVSIFFIIAEVICCLFFRENAHDKSEMETSTVKEMFSALFHNDQALFMVVSIVLFYIAMYVSQGFFIYFFKYNIGGADWNMTYSLFTTVGSIANLVGMVAVYPALRRMFSNTQIFTFDMIALIIGYAALFLVCSAGLINVTPLLMAIGIVIFACNGMTSILITIFLSNSVDYGHLKTGKREESMIFSMQTFVVKAGSGLAVFLVGVGLDLVGLVGNADTEGEIIKQSTETLMGLDTLMTIPALIAIVLALFVFKKKWILTDEKSAEILAELKATGELDG